MASQHHSEACSTPCRHPPHTHTQNHARSSISDIMGLLEKCRALGYSRSAELMGDVRCLQGKCRQAVSKWGGDPETGGGFGAGAGRIVVRAMDTLAAIMESMLARSRDEVGRGFGFDRDGISLVNASYMGHEGVVFVQLSTWTYSRMAHFMAQRNARHAFFVVHTFWSYVRNRVH